MKCPKCDTVLNRSILRDPGRCHFCDVDYKYLMQTLLNYIEQLEDIVLDIRDKWERDVEFFKSRGESQQ